MFNQRFSSECFIDNVLDNLDLICLHRIKGFQFIIFLVQPCLSQEGQNVIHFDIVEQTPQTIHLEKSLSDGSEGSIFYGNVFNGARRLTCRTLWLLFLFQY